MIPTHAAERSGSTNGRNRSLVNGLGWFSIGLGLLQVVTPGAVAALIGLRDNPKTRGLLRSYGVREIAAGIGILSQARPANWVWSRVAGDVLDLSSLASALKSNRNTKTRVVATTAAVAGITALDVLAAQKLSTNGGHGPEKVALNKATRFIIVDLSPEETYNFWRNFENLPRFMTHLESVRTTGDGLSHWIAVGPGGRKIEWDAELMHDEPGRLIAWRSASNSGFEKAGSVRFEAAPGGRGTIVRVEMNYATSSEDIGRRILHDLRNFKQVLEVGEVTESGDRR